jgi:membrane-bound lytic murein transglycosylase D
VAPLPVPAELQFAGLRLRLSDGGRAAVQQKVDALRRHPGSFYARVATADAAFPIIERVLQEEGVPLDFRFLCIQESGLQGDAQSIHDAVGYWQFKREAAADFGLEVSDNVDERKHLVAATHGAAKYLLRSQRMYQNWLHTLLSYNLGPGGVKPYTLPTDAGATEMQITEQTHPYVLTFLAHKLAYESAIGTNPRPAMRLREYPAIAGQSLASLAQAIQTDPAELSKHNRWLLAAAVPPGRSYTALVPVTDSLQLLAMSVQQRQVATKLVTAPETDPHNAAFVTVNGLRAVVALPGESKEDLARRAGVKLRKFMQFNDLMPFDAVVVGQPYFTQKKRDKATVEYHVTQAGESLATVSQKYGVRARAIRSKNRMAANENLQPGRVLWLQHTRPRAVAVEYVQDKTGAVAAAMERPTGQPAPAAPAPVAPAPTPAAPAPPKRKPAEAEVSTSRPAAPQRGVVDDAPEASEDSTRTGGLLGKLQQPAAETADEAPADSAAAADETVANLNEAAEATPVPPANPAPAPAKANRDLYAGQADNKQLPASSPLADEPSGADGDEEPVPAVTRPVAAAPNPAPATKPAPAAATPAPTASAAVPAAPKSVTTAATPTAPKPAATVSAAPKPAPSAAPRPTPAAPAAPGPALEPGAGWPVPANGLHTVQAKETLYGVARRYNLRPADLIQWNNLPPNPALQLGQVLRVTPPAAGTAAPATAAAPSASTPKPSAPAPAKPAPAPVAAAGGVKHTVVSGDTMYSISRKYGVTPKQIMDWNGKADSNVRLGEVLTVQPAAQ